MVLNEYQRKYVAWTIICYIFVDACLEFTCLMTPWIINLDFGIERKFAIVNHPAWLPVEWLPFIPIIWLIGCAIIWAINRFR